jgi:hypothetical protein
VTYADDRPIVHRRGTDWCIACLIDGTNEPATGDGGGWSLCARHLEAFAQLGLDVVDNAARVTTLHHVVARLWFAPPAHGDKPVTLDEYRTSKTGDRWPIPEGEFAALGVSLQSVRACPWCGGSVKQGHSVDCRRR